MAGQEEVMKALSLRDKPCPGSELAQELGVTAADLATPLKRLREKKPPYIEGSTKEGWAITDAGRKAMQEGPVVPSMVEEGVDAMSKFKSLGRMTGLPDDRVELTAQIVWSGNHEDLNWVWDAMGQADIRGDLKKVWFNAWRAYLKKSIPPELQEEMDEEVEEDGEDTEKRTKDKSGRERRGRDYIIVDDVPAFVGSGMGDFSLRDAKEILAVRALKARLSGSGGGDSSSGGVKVQGISLQDLQAIVGMFKDKEQPRGQNYVVQMTPEGTEVKPLEEGKPFVVENKPLPGPPSPKSYFFDRASGVFREITPGEVVSSPDPPAAKGYFFDRSAGKIIEVTPGEIKVGDEPSPPQMPTLLLRDGQPVFNDLDSLIKWQHFLGEEKREQEKHDVVIGAVQQGRELITVGGNVIKRVLSKLQRREIEERAADTGTVPKCTECGAELAAEGAPEGYLLCTNPECGRGYTIGEVS